MSESYRDILVARDGPVVTIRINRPAARNACRAQTLDELCAALAAAGEDAEVGAIVVAGAGDKAFSAGADLKEMAAVPESASIQERMRGWWALLDILEAMRKPLIAAVQGYAVGGGTEIALACHIVIAAESARFGLPEILRGHIPGAGGTVNLPRHIGRGPGLYYLLTGDDIPADVALRVGLAAQVVPDAALEKTALALARRLADHAPAAVAATIESVVRGSGLSKADALQLERDLCARIRGSEDFWEGFHAFVEKRPARYGRNRKNKKDAAE